jgi:hypothetical protein
MHPLAEQFFALPAEGRRVVHFALCEHALQIWNRYSTVHERIRYTESVCGTSQVVDSQLPGEAFEAAKRNEFSTQLETRYREPITAMQEDDLSFPEDVQFAWYAVYNLFCRYAQKEAVDDWLIVNQALASEKDPQKQDILLAAAISAAHDQESL